MGIGVTEFIARQEVRDKISKEFPNPGTDVKGELKVSHASYEHSLLGQAFDYLVRIWLEKQCETVKDPYGAKSRGGDWTSHIDYSHNQAWYDLPKERRDVINDAQERAAKKREQFVETGMNVNDAIDASLVFSGLERNVGFEEGTIESNSFEDDIVTELQELFQLLRKQDDLVGKSVIISPTFGERWFILEGHADFIVDNTLFDVKTTEDPRFQPAYWRQLLAYYVLNDIHREVIANEVDTRGNEISYPELTAVGIYFARYGVAKTIDISEYLQPRNKYEEFRAWFVDRAIEQNHDGRVNYDPFHAVLTDPYDFEEQTSLSDF